MAVVISPIDINTETFLDWVTATNTAIDVISTSAVTTGGVPAVGNAIVAGSFQTDGLFADVLSGGSIGSPGNLSVATNTSFTSNVSFGGANTSLGSFGNITLLGSNTTHNVVGVNPVTNKLVMKNLPNFAVSGAPISGSTLYWNGSAFVDSTAIKVSGSDVTITSDVILGGRISANGSYGSSGSTLMSNGTNVYWSIGSQSTTANGFISTGGANSNFNSNLLFINPTTQKIGVKTATPNNTFEVVGTLNATTVYSNNSPVWTAANDGVGSGLDADLLDGLNSTDFIRRNVASDTTGVVTFSSGLITNTINSVSTATNISFNANNFGFSQLAPIHKVDIGGSLRATGSAYIHAPVYLGLLGATNVPGTIDLLKSSGSTLSGNVTITTSGNSLRFFENGGTNRGAYLDLSSTGAGVSSKILTEADLSSSPQVLAMVTFSGGSATIAPTILHAKNVSTITRQAAGRYTINFTTPLATANYAVSIVARENASYDGTTGAIYKGTTPTTSSFQIQIAGYGYPASTASSSSFDSDYVTVAVMG
jgi:hypothetical protein